MHLKGLERTWAEIKTSETHARARELLEASVGKFGLTLYEMTVMSLAEVSGVPAPNVIVAIPEAVEGGVSVGECQVSFSEGRPEEAARMVEIYKGNPVLEPITDSDWEVGEPGPGVMPEGDTHESVAEIPAVGMIGGWPEKAEITISGLAPNRRHLRGILPDSRVVTVERTFRKEWKGGERVSCRLIRAGAAPLFRVA